MATVCEASELLKQRIIPPMSPPNDAPEAVCKLPAKIPTMAALDIRAAYEFTAAELDTPITPEYVAVDGSNPPATAEDCVENTDVSTGKFTWVDWLTPVKALEGDRHWIIDTELDCTEDGDLSEDTAFKRPALPMNQYTPVLPTPIAPALAIPTGTGGGGGGSVEKECCDLVELIDGELVVHPIYMRFQAGCALTYVAFMHNAPERADGSAYIPTMYKDGIDYDIKDAPDGIYYLYAYFSGLGLPFDVVNYPDTHQVTLVWSASPLAGVELTAPGSYSIKICKVFISSNKISFLSALCSRVNEFFIGPQGDNNDEVKWAISAFVKIVNTETLFTYDDGVVQLVGVAVQGGYIYRNGAIRRTLAVRFSSFTSYQIGDFLWFYINAETDGSIRYRVSGNGQTANPYDLGYIYQHSSGLLSSALFTQSPIIILPEQKGFTISVSFNEKENKHVITVLGGDAVLSGTSTGGTSKSRVTIPQKEEEVEITATGYYYVYLIMDVTADPVVSIQVMNTTTPIGRYGRAVQLGYVYFTISGGWVNWTIRQRAVSPVEIGPIYMGPFCFLPGPLNGNAPTFIVNPRGGYTTAAAAPTVNGLTSILGSPLPVVSPSSSIADTETVQVALYFWPPVFNAAGTSIATPAVITMQLVADKPTGYEGSYILNNHNTGIPDISWINSSNQTIGQVIANNPLTIELS